MNRLEGLAAPVNCEWTKFSIRTEKQQYDLPVGWKGMLHDKYVELTKRKENDIEGDPLYGTWELTFEVRPLPSAE